MNATLGFVRSITAAVRNFTACFWVLLFLLPLLASHVSAQTTTITGTVYDPRTTASSLPLPNVLVYVTSAAVAPLPAGVQCLTTSDPTGVVSFTYTAVDGTFTLANVPVNASYTVVIQAGKWRRQFPETVAAVPLTGLTLHMPSDHTQGDIPKIAIATGSVDALECVLLHMGIAQTEFSDDNGDPNHVLPIHLYKGMGTAGNGSAGADINASSPNQSTLMSTAATMNNYDVMMFPCQGNAYVQSATAEQNLLNYANAGGRVFATHYSFVWLDPATPYDSLFPPVVNWAVNQADPTPDPGVAMVNTGFTDGATLAQWLQNAGSLYQNTPGQIQISTLRHDFNGVIAPTQSWLTLNNPVAGNPVMQFTFNTPVAAPAANQCGRVLYNEYHVFAVGSSTGQVFPAECAATIPASAQAQVNMLEYALFDLSSFVTPVVVPTLSIGFNPSPLIVKQGDTGDQVTVNVANTSSTVEIYSSVVLTLTLPANVTATSLVDSTGGWTCTLGTLTCTRTTSIAASASDSVTLTVSVGTYGSSTTSGVITATASSPNFSNNVSNTDNVVFQQPPVITWPTPANIVYGTALGGAQLDATTTVAGAFSYTPAAGTVLAVGQHTLMVTFSPTDTTHYTSSSASVMLTVVPVTPSLSLTSNSNPVFLSNAVSFTATIASQATPPTGTVTFYDGANQIGTGTVASGVATFTTAALTMAKHSITAIYSGDSSYGPATSGAVAENVEDFTLAPAGGGTVAVAAGGSAFFPIGISPVGGNTLPGAMTFKVDGISLGSTSSFAPSTVAAGSTGTTVTLQVQLPGKAATEFPGRPFRGGSLPLMLSLILLPFAAGMRKAARQWKSMAVLALLGIALVVGVTGCGSNGKLNSTDYSLTVTATSGSLSHTTSLKLTIQ